ncbi:MAG: hypothetical protein M1396_04430 [Chloroflexi bacterium]|nr:hypothetical protein [Chloroflexota bacterium]MCL5947401.1 hypothetical protein [Chloroflexota bacterium]
MSDKLSLETANDAIEPSGQNTQETLTTPEPSLPTAPSARSTSVRQLTAAEAALQLTLKWMDHAAEASELALSDPEQAEQQARSVNTFFVSVLDTLRSHFPSHKEPADQ